MKERQLSHYFRLGSTSVHYQSLYGWGHKVGSPRKVICHSPELVVDAKPLRPQDLQNVGYGWPFEQVKSSREKGKRSALRCPGKRSDPPLSHFWIYAFFTHTLIHFLSWMSASHTSRFLFVGYQITKIQTGSGSDILTLAQIYGRTLTLAITQSCRAHHTHTHTRTHAYTILCAVCERLTAKQMLKLS